MFICLVILGLLNSAVASDKIADAPDDSQFQTVLNQVDDIAKQAQWDSASLLPGASGAVTVDEPGRVVKVVEPVNGARYHADTTAFFKHFDRLFSSYYGNKPKQTAAAIVGLLAASYKQWELNSNSYFTVHKLPVLPKAYAEQSIKFRFAGLPDVVVPFRDVDTDLDAIAAIMTKHNLNNENLVRFIETMTLNSVLEMFLNGSYKAIEGKENPFRHFDPAGIQCFRERLDGIKTFAEKELRSWLNSDIKRHRCYSSWSTEARKWDKPQEGDNPLVSVELTLPKYLTDNCQQQLTGHDLFRYCCIIEAMFDICPNAITDQAAMFQQYLGFMKEFGCKADDDCGQRLTALEDLPSRLLSRTTNPLQKQKKKRSKNKNSASVPAVAAATTPSTDSVINQQQKTLEHQVHKAGAEITRLQKKIEKGQKNAASLQDQIDKLKAQAEKNIATRDELTKQNAEKAQRINTLNAQNSAFAAENATLSAENRALETKLKAPDTRSQELEQMLTIKQQQLDDNFKLWHKLFAEKCKLEADLRTSKAENEKLTSQLAKAKLSLATLKEKDVAREAEHLASLRERQTPPAQRQAPDGKQAVDHQTSPDNQDMALRLLKGQVVKLKRDIANMSTDPATHLPGALEFEGNQGDKVQLRWPEMINLVNILVQNGCSTPDQLYALLKQAQPVEQAKESPQGGDQ